MPKGKRKVIEEEDESENIQSVEDDEYETPNRKKKTPAKKRRTTQPKTPKTPKSTAKEIKLDEQVKEKKKKFSFKKL